MRSGNPRRRASARSSVSPLRAEPGGEPGTTGTPAFSMAARARGLSPIASMAEGGGPTHVRPASITARAKPAFSERNPYPGWTASAPLSRATSSSRPIDRYVSAGVPGPSETARSTLRVWNAPASASA